MISKFLSNFMLKKYHYLGMFSLFFVSCVSIQEENQVQIIEHEFLSKNNDTLEVIYESQNKQHADWKVSYNKLKKLTDSLNYKVVNKK